MNKFDFLGRDDTSGIRLTYTPTRRSQSAGLLQIGNIDGIFVPPQIDEFNIVAYCGSTCTNQVGLVRGESLTDIPESVSDRNLSK